MTILDEAVPLLARPSGAASSAAENGLSARTVAAREDIERDRASVSPAYERLATNLLGLVTSVAIARGVVPTATEWRLKSVDSIEAQLWRKGVSNATDLADFCGLRVVVGTRTEQRLIEQIIYETLIVDEHQCHGDPLEGHGSGYRSTHFHVRSGPDRLALPEWSRLEGLRAEIQVRTAFEHAWAERSHELAYKGEVELPAPLIHLLRQASAQIEVADEKIDNFVRAMADLMAAYENQACTDAWPDLELDALSLRLCWHRFPWEAIADGAVPLGYQLEAGAVAGDDSDRGDLLGLARSAGFSTLGALHQRSLSVCTEDSDWLTKVARKASALGFTPWAIGPEILSIALLRADLSKFRLVHLSPRLKRAMAAVESI